MLILIVDDDPDDIELFVEALGEVDDTIECTSSENGDEALKLLKSKNSRKPDFIFLDLNMPRLNGKQFLIELKRNSALSDIPVIILTTSKLKEDKEETKRLGAVHFITKPPIFADLIRSITRVLSHEWERN
jgi:CheY-like chemotaxis protein